MVCIEALLYIVISMIFIFTLLLLSQLTIHYFVFDCVLIGLMLGDHTTMNVNSSKLLYLHIHSQACEACEAVYEGVFFIICRLVLQPQTAAGPGEMVSRLVLISRPRLCNFTWLFVNIVSH